MSDSERAGSSLPRPVVPGPALHGILESLADAVIIVDADGMVRYANPAAERLLGRAGESLVGQQFGAPLVAGETTELDLIRPGGEAAAAEMRVVSMEWQGQPAFCASLRDMTERRLAEAQRIMLADERAARRQAEAAVAQRDEFLSVAAHELKTPVTRLRLAVQLALRQLQLRGSLDPGELARRLELLEDETGRLAQLVTQLLDLSRIDRGRLSLEVQGTDLAALARGAVEAARRVSTTHHIVLVSPERLPAEVDPLRIEQVFTNLLDNAIKFSPDGGKIAVEVNDGNPHIARLSVRDWGIGIPPERRAGLFGRFYQAHAGSHMTGLGVGLFVTHEIVTMHGGAIEAHFPPDGGTEIRVVLPRHLGTPSSPVRRDG